MINLVIITHGEIGKALIEAAEMIIGPAKHVYSIPFEKQDTPEELNKNLSSLLEDIAGEPTLVLVDVFGGTPYNIAARLLSAENIECLSGVNLPMLIEALLRRESLSLPELTEQLHQAGQESIKNIKRELREFQARKPAGQP